MQNHHYPGRANSTGDNIGHDYGHDLGWALEYNAAPLIVEEYPTDLGVLIVPTPSSAAMFIAAALVLVIWRPLRCRRPR